MNFDPSSLSPLANHLWQSSVFVTAIWLLTLMLKKNRAAVRYGLWFAASVKFLIPFSVLVALGSQLSWRTEPFVAQAYQWSFVADNAVQPFTVPAIPTYIASPRASFSIVSILIAVWFCGVAAGVLYWLKCWTQMWRIRRAATPLPLRLSIPVLSSASQIEPGVFGILRPVLLLPAGIESRLTPSQLDAILAHEMAHVRRRDNLTAAIHMLVETLLWFFPLVWWLRARLIEEREKACDEEVLQMGLDPETYAQGIVGVCKIYAESLMPCAAGVSGSDLRQRLKRILNLKLGQNLTPMRKAILTTFCFAAVMGPAAWGIVNAPPLRGQVQPATQEGLSAAFEAASIKRDNSGTTNHTVQMPGPGRIHTVNASARSLIEFAYSLRDIQLTGGPAWTSSQGYVLDAKADEATATQLQKLPGPQQRQQMQLMMRSLLTARFKLALSHQTKELPIYALIVAKGGPKLKPTAYKPPDSSWKDALFPPSPPHVLIHPGVIDVYAEPIESLAGLLGLIPDLSDRIIEDQTGIKGSYNFVLHFSPQNAPPRPAGSPASGPPEDSAPSIFTALEEQLGLRLESTKGPVDTYVIDHIEEPTPN